MIFTPLGGAISVDGKTNGYEVCVKDRRDSSC